MRECNPISLGGEIGRHKRLKISRQKWRTGSIPVPGTTKYTSYNLVQSNAIQQKQAVNRFHLLFIFRTITVNSVHLLLCFTTELRRRLQHGFFYEGKRKMKSVCSTEGRWLVGQQRQRH